MYKQLLYLEIEHLNFKKYPTFEDFTKFFSFRFVNYKDYFAYMRVLKTCYDKLTPDLSKRDTNSLKNNR